MNEDLEQVTAHFLDAEPVLVAGCTGAEIGVIILLSIVASTVIGVFLLGILFGLWGATIPFVLLLSGITSVVLSKMLRSSKRGKPEGYYSQSISVKLKEMGVVKDLIHKNGVWEIGL